MGIYLSSVTDLDTGQTIDVSGFDDADTDYVITVPSTGVPRLSLDFDQVQIAPAIEVSDLVTGLNGTVGGVPITDFTMFTAGRIFGLAELDSNSQPDADLALTFSDIGGGPLVLGEEFELTVSGTNPADTDTITIRVGDSFTANPVCFAPGTQIATPDGEIPVEGLRIGDLVTTSDGRQVPVKWIGRQTLHKLFTPAERFAPVRIRAGALGDGLPRTDLVLTPDHAVIIEGLAISASVLVNNSSIIFEPMELLPERAIYFHVETEDHEIIRANGAPAETYVDYVGRRAFDNYQEYIDLYGDEREISEMNLPRVSSARLLPSSIRDRLANVAAA